MGHDEEKIITIIVNGRPKEVYDKKMSYEEVVKLAFEEVVDNPDVVYTVTYSKGNKPEKGTMVKGDFVTLKKEMIFNVTKTDRS